MMMKQNVSALPLARRSTDARVKIGSEYRPHHGMHRDTDTGAFWERHPPHDADANLLQSAVIGPGKDRQDRSGPACIIGGLVLAAAVFYSPQLWRYFTGA